MGGGTPSLFDAEQLDRLLAAIRARLPFAPNIEITLEANPGTVEIGRFKEYRDIGINRLSIGVQSFNDDALQRLGRIHNRRDAIRAAEQAHAAGFDNFNLDLMFGLPQQNIQLASADLQTAIDLETPHLSWYQLTIEPNTWFHTHPPSLPVEDVVVDIYEHGQQILLERGFQQYEISAYAREKHSCQHNINYWLFGDYLGIGAGAHGKITSAQTQTITRHAKVKHPRDYLQTASQPERIQTTRRLTPQDTLLEFFMNALRLNNGFNIETFQNNTGLTLDICYDILHKAMENGWLEQDAAGIRCTATGHRYLNEVLELFIPEV